jgi:branched-subunit amino acid ABC-type transport system permease component
MTSAVVVAQIATGFDKFLNAIINGIALGAVYALLALGFVLIFKATQVINFAHGALAAVGAFLTASFATILNFPGRFLPDMPNWSRWALSALFAVLAAALVGLLVERIFIRPMIGEPLFSVAIITIGVDIVLRTINDDFVGQGARTLGDPWGIQVIDVGNPPRHRESMSAGCSRSPGRSVLLWLQSPGSFRRWRRERPGLPISPLLSFFEPFLP